MRLWSHGPAHIHFVVQPIRSADVDATGKRGPDLQAAMFGSGQVPSNASIEDFANEARRRFRQ